jgi:hypothetical protein
MNAHANTNPGCLAGLLRLFGLASLAPKPYQPPPPVSSEAFAQVSSPIAADSVVVEEPLPYRLRDNFLTAAELSFYHVLRLALKDTVVIQTRVSLADIFFTARPHENQAARARIAQKHVDFLLCEPQSLRPLVAIELDDASHAREDRQERDQFVNEVFAAAGLPLVHQRAQRTYNTAELAAGLADYLSPAGPPASTLTAAPAAADQPPLCPKCGIPMVLRTAARGAHAGEPFYGCRNYPDCHAMLPYAAPPAAAS